MAWWYTRGEGINSLADAVQRRVAADGHGEAAHVVVDRANLQSASEPMDPKQHGSRCTAQAFAREETRPCVCVHVFVCVYTAVRVHLRAHV